MSNSPNTSGEVVFDYTASAAYTAAATQAAELLTAAAGGAARAAAFDLSGLGALGEDFAVAWAAAWGNLGKTVGTAAVLTDAYGQAVKAWGEVMAATDAHNAGAIGGAVADTTVREV
ncbi:hypothetical protein IU474_12410 [Nocardia otitidiscaviarum]|uniref:hypothetical protein n=1 Tax=Nocardia otitidiscaviarum TaxID=1823 RepID=UPI0018956A4F|nr:hypothetical protein [Nocardia otitidiscaviarum]MBF6237868.1 hypothetical protein [Nocardia otitidiscaviarum]